MPLRALSFEKMYPPIDEQYKREAETTYARELQERFKAVAEEAGVAGSDDVLSGFEDKAVGELMVDEGLIQRIRDSGVAWGELKAYLAARLPEELEDRDNIAFRLVERGMTTLLGAQGTGWHTFDRDRGGRRVKYVKAGPGTS